MRIGAKYDQRVVDQIVNEIVEARSRREDILAVRGHVSLSARYAMLHNAKHKLQRELDRMQPGVRAVYHLLRRQMVRDVLRNG